MPMKEGTVGFNANGAIDISPGRSPGTDGYFGITL